MSNNEDTWGDFFDKYRYRNEEVPRFEQIVIQHDHDRYRAHVGCAGPFIFDNLADLVEAIENYLSDPVAAKWAYDRAFGRGEVQPDQRSASPNYQGMDHGSLGRTFSGAGARMESTPQTEFWEPATDGPEPNQEEAGE